MREQIYHMHFNSIKRQTGNHRLFLIYRSIGFSGNDQMMHSIQTIPYDDCIFNHTFITT